MVHWSILALRKLQTFPSTHYYTSKEAVWRISENKVIAAAHSAISHYYYGSGWRFGQAALFFLLPLLRQRVAFLTNSLDISYNTYTEQNAKMPDAKGRFPRLLPTPPQITNCQRQRQKKNGQGRSLVRLRCSGMYYRFYIIFTYLWFRILHLFAHNYIMR